MHFSWNYRCVVPSALSLALFAASLPIAGCGGSGTGVSTPTPPAGPTAPAPSAANSFFVTENPITAFLPITQGPNILQFPRTASGTVSPTAIITGPVGLNFNAIAVDSAGNIYAGGPIFSTAGVQSGSEIEVYAAGASGTATPTRTITSGLSSLITTGIFSMAIDSANNLYVATDVTVGSGSTGRVYEGVAIYASGASTSSRVIAGDATGIVNPSQIAVDAAGNVYVASTGIEAAGSIEVFSPTASGNAAPIRTITGDATTIYNTRGIAVDATGNIFVSTITLAPANGPYLAGTPSIAEFAPTATGNIAPISAISGTAAGLGQVGNISLDSSGNIYALGGAGALKFAAGGTGNVAPTASIVSASSTVGIGGPGIAVQ